MSNWINSWRYQFSAERWIALFRNRLWLGLPATMLFAFILIVGVALGFDAPSKVALNWGVKEAVIAGVTYLIGLFVATCSTPEEQQAEWEEAEKASKAQMATTKRWKSIARVIAGFILLLFLIAIMIIPEYMDWRAGEATAMESVIRSIGTIWAGCCLTLPQILQPIMNR